MRRRFGHQRWWPGRTPFEICVGAILTQNTSWKNVELAISNLREAGVLNIRGMVKLRHDRLGKLIHPAGCFNVKANRLRAFLSTLMDGYGGSLKRLFRGETSVVRKRLLKVPGIGPETADCMLLYAGGHASFVVDAYTRRIFFRHNWCRVEEGYDDLKSMCEAALDCFSGDRLLNYWGDWHAQLVMLGKTHCHAKSPDCENCPLKPLLP